MTETEEQKHGRYLRKAFALADHVGLTKSERHELASLIGFSTSGSWKELSIQQLHDLMTMLEGFAFVTFIINSRMEASNE
jgi:hypothetical protein